MKTASHAFIAASLFAASLFAAETTFTPNRFKNTIVHEAAEYQFTKDAIPVPAYSPYPAGYLVLYRDNDGLTYGNLMIKRIRNDGFAYSPYSVNSSGSASLLTALLVPSTNAGAIACWQRNDTIFASRRYAIGSIYTGSAWAGYTHGKPIITTTYSKSNLSMVSDGAEGAILAWMENRGSYTQVYVQRVDVNGNIKWGLNGRTAWTTPTASSNSLKMVPAGSGSAVVAWYDNRGPDGNDIYAQRVSGADSVGFTLNWGSSGKGVSAPMAGDQTEFNICSDDSAGLFVAFVSDGGSTGKDLYLQRINQSGTRRNTSGGIVLCNAAGTQRNPVITAFTGQFGKHVYVAWEDRRDSALTGADIYGVMAYCSGTSYMYTDGAYWGSTNGMKICNQAGAQDTAKILLDTTTSMYKNVLVAWTDQRNGNKDIYASKLTYQATQATGWTTINGMPITQAAGDQPYKSNYYPWNILRNDNLSGEFLFIWTGYSNSDYNIYMQKESQGGDYIDRIGPPTPGLYPEPDANNLSPVLQWNTVSDGFKYYVEVASDFRFNIILASDSLAGTSYGVPAGLVGNGQYYWHVKVRDDGDNYSAWSVSDTFKIDTISPSWSGFTIQEGDSTNQTYPYLRAICTDPGAIKWDSSTIVMKVDGNVVPHTQWWPSNPSYVRYTPTMPLADNDWHRVAWFARDSAGNGNYNDTAAINFYVSTTLNDLTPPQFSNPSPAESSLTNQTGGLLTVNVSDPSGVIAATTVMRINYTTIGEATCNVLNGQITSVVSPSFVEGWNRVDVSINDASINNNLGTWYWYFRVDATAPNPPSFSIASQTVTNPMLIVWGNGEMGTQAEIFNNDSFVVSRPVGSGNYFQYDSLMLTEGMNRVGIRLVDSAGNVGDSTFDTVFLDTRVPDAPQFLADRIPAVTSNATVLVWGVAERKAAVTLWVNGSNAGWQNMGETDTFGIVVTIGNGDNAITTRQTDSSGNTSLESEPFYVRLDQTVPILDSLYPAAGDTLISLRPTLWAALHDSGGAGLNADSLKFRVNGMAVTATWDGISMFSYTVPSDLADQSWHTFSFDAMDQAGNWLNSGDFSFYVDRSSNDNIPPVIASYSPTVTQTTAYPFIKVVAQDFENGLDEAGTAFFIDGILKTHAYLPAMNEITYQITVGLSQGWHHCSLYVADASTNHNSTYVTWDFLIDSDAPSVPVLNALPSYTRFNTATVSGSAGEPGALIQLYLNGSAIASTNSDAAGGFNFDGISLAYGTNSFTATAADSLNNTSATSQAVSTLMDDVAPSVISLSPADGDTVGVLFPTYTIQVSDGSGTGVNPDSLYLEINSVQVPYAMISYSNGTFTYLDAAMPLQQGQHSSYQLSVRDYAGNASLFMGASFDVDTLSAESNPPEFSNPSPAPNTAVNNATPDIRINISDVSGVDPASIVMTVDNVGVTTELNGNEVKHRPDPGLAEGLHVIKVEAADLSPLKNQGNIEWVFSVDLQRPARPTINQASTPTNSDLITITGSTEPFAALVLLRGTDTVASLSTGATGGFMTSVYLVEGENAITGVAMDTAGNQSSVTQAMRVTLDTRPPGFESVYPAYNSYVSDSRPVISAVLYDSGAGLDLSRLFLVITDVSGDTLVGDSATAGQPSFSAATRTLSWQPSTPLPDSTRYFVSYIITDLAGNLRTSSGFFITGFAGGDQTPPQVTDMAPTGIINNRTPAISATVIDNTQLDLVATTLKLDGLVVTLTFDSVLNKIFYQPSTALSEGVEHPVILTALDTSGNQTLKQWSFTIDATAPVAPVINAPPAFTKGLSSALSGSSEARSAVEIIILGASAGSGATDDSGRFTVSTVALNEGPNQIRAQARDAADNVSGLSQAVTVFADIRTPILLSSSPLAGSRAPLSPAITAQLADTGFASGINPSTVTLFLDGAGVPVQFIGGSARMDTAVTLSQGNHTYSIQAQDSAGNLLSSNQVSFIADPAYVDNVPPVISGFTPANNARISDIRPLISAVITDAASSVDSASVLLSINLDPVTGYAFNPADGRLTYTPSSDLRTNNQVEVIAADAAGNRDTVSWRFSVDTVSPARPLFLNTPDSLVSASFVTLHGVADSGSGIFLFRDSVQVNYLPALASDTFIIPDQPVQKGVNAFTLVAYDDVGNASLPSETLNVIYNTAPPVIANKNILSAEAQEDSSFQLQVIASDADGNRLYYQMYQPLRPDTLGLSIDTNGLLSLNPTLPGAYTVRIRVHDGFGRADTMAFLMTVNPVNDAPVITGLRDTVLASHDSAAIPFTVTDEEDNGALDSVGVLNPQNASMRVIHGTGTNYFLTFVPTATFTGVFHVFAFDGADSVFDTVVISVGNAAPVLAGLRDTSMSRVDSVRMSFSVSDADDTAMVSYGLLNPPDPSMRLVRSGSAFTLSFFADSSFSDSVRVFVFDGYDSAFAAALFTVNVQAVASTIAFAGPSDTLRLKLGTGSDTLSLFLPYDTDIIGRFVTIQRFVPAAGDSAGHGIPIIGAIFDLSGLDSGFTARLVLPIPASDRSRRGNLNIFTRADSASPWEAVLARDTSLFPGQLAVWLSHFSQYALGLDTVAPRLRIDSVNTNYRIYSTLFENIRNPQLTFNYREAGEDAVTSLKVKIMAGAQDTCVSAIPSAFMNAATAAVEFWLTATDGIRTDTTAHRTLDKIMAGPLLPSSALPRGNFRMVSLPFNADEKSPDSVLGALIVNDTLAWRIGRWRGTAIDRGAYVDHVRGGNNAFLALRPGSAVWVYSSAGSTSGLPLSRAISTPIVLNDSLTQGFEVPLTVGWNQVGNPYPFTVKAADVVLDTSEVQDVFYAYDASNGAYSAATHLDPYSGYWVLARAATSIVFPSLPPTAGLGKTCLDSSAWMADISLAGKGGTSSIRIGEAFAASEGWNAGADLVGPPAITCGLEAALPHTDWKGWPSAHYIQDVRGLAAEGNAWKVVLRRQDAATASFALNLASPAALPASEGLFAYFPQEAMRVDLKAASGHKVVLASGEATGEFWVVAGSAGYIDRMTRGAKEPPARSGVEQNYPNPFNPATTIRYQIKDADNVLLSVYNMKGQLVNRIVNRFHKQGYYSTQWNGRDAKGRMAASGVYVYQLQSGRFVKTLRMLMVK